MMNKDANEPADFDIAVEHRGVTKIFHGTFSKYGYSYRFTISVQGVDAIFEPDEERNLRAIVPPGIEYDSTTKELVTLIGHELGKLLSS
jgi:hypothetical protein